ncbi:MAG: bifunctional nicotinamidase/pyrazinamidase [Pseudomonadales bacterium]|jgi:nicotinamidase/pyrazinamidase|nr:bifunctional nicotinamidase/pyrazinamidase [Pseudomonadales bacterium]MDP7357555.1 bifunctional nicotinamidase/pyrazinamidase [Pseudomonadales bacterium]MDP7597846.1 bifunctional nicotinamidase/pyrazinamidase [Pseudomonadales bacterium]HJN51082.1 bifunctional nicotinamidase/pyrazinamidase [Pseudomonadales bacterium]|tara:strand:+ start:5036 stop:5650 length:615 start_codon:yes stop_codon:yes gene_type:complete
MNKTLVLVDIQNDFVSGGALAVPQGELVVPIANRIMGRFDRIVATQDWHPANHGSFASQYPEGQVGDFIDLNGIQQILWPDHCVQHSEGAAFVAELDMARVERVFQKGTDSGVDSYSGFFDNGHRLATGLDEFLTDAGVTGITVMGLATDYCIKATVLDALQLGYAVDVILEGVRGVEGQTGDAANAIEAMADAGANMVHAADL